MNAATQFLAELQSDNEEKLLTCIRQIDEMELSDISLLPRLFDLGKHGTGPIRHNVLAVLVNFAMVSRDVSPFLAEVFFSDTEPDNLRCLAAASLTRIGRSSESIFRTAINSNERLLIVGALGFLAGFDHLPAEYGPRLLELLDTSDTEVLDCLRQCFEYWPESISFLRSHFEERSVQRRNVVIAALILYLWTRQRERSANQAIPPEILDIIAASLQIDDEELRGIAVYFLQDVPEMDKQLRPSLEAVFRRSSDQNSRAWALMLLDRATEDKNLYSVFESALRDPDPEIRLTALTSRTAAANAESMSGLLEAILFDESLENARLAAQLLTASRTTARKVRESLRRAYLASSDPELKETLEEFV